MRINKLFMLLLSLMIIVMVYPSFPINVYADTEIYLNSRGGFSDGWGYSSNDIARMLDDAERLHAMWIRVDIKWSRVQKDGADSWDWRFSDSVIDAATAPGIKVIALPSYTPSWANGGSGSDTAYPQTQADIEAWAHFVTESGKRYIPKGVTVWEIWNEPNRKDTTPEQYTEQILKPGSDAIRRVSYELETPITVLLAAMAPLLDLEGVVDPYHALPRIYNSGGKDYFDAVAVHPYCQPHSPDAVNKYNHLLRVPELRQVMVSNGDGHKQIWATEFGYPTTYGSGSIAETQQAEYMIKAYDIWCNFGDWAGPMIWYSYLDSGVGTTDAEQNFGLRRNNWAVKPGLDVFGEVLSEVSEPLPPITSGYIPGSRDLTSGFESITEWTGNAKKYINTDIKSEGEASLHVIYNIPGMCKMASPWIDNRLSLENTVDLSGKIAILVDVYPLSQTSAGFNEPLIILIKDKTGGVIYRQQVNHLTAEQWNTVSVDISDIDEVRRQEIYEINFYVWTGYTKELNKRTNVQYLFDDMRCLN